MKTVKINRKYWLNGLTAEDTKMCDANNRRCCLGFAVNQVCRITLDAMKEDHFGTPAEVFSWYEMDVKNSKNRKLFAFESMFTDSTSNAFASEAISINDDIHITNEEREARLTELFKGQGMNLVFYGKYPTKKELEKWGDNIADEYDE